MITNISKKRHQMIPHNMRYHSYIIIGRYYGISIQYSVTRYPISWHI